MNTTIRYWFPNTQQCRYVSFKTYQQALDQVKFFTQMNVKAEVKLY